MKKCNVLVTYRNSRLEPVHTELYSLRDYTDLMRTDLLKVITDIESAFYSMCGNRQKSEWPDSVWSDFEKIKHKLLDKAGDIGRLPDNLIEEGKTCQE